MRPEIWDTIVVGGGIAGVEAALGVEERGARVLLLDENPVLGGQYLRPMLKSGQKIERLRTRGLHKVDKLRSSKVKILSHCEVLSLSEDRELVFRQHSGSLFESRAHTVLLACGARERFLPFPGWTLPGVISTGVTQLLVKSSGRFPAEHLIVAGSGVFPYAVAAQVLAAGGKVQALVDQNSILQKAALTPALARLPYKWGDALYYLSRVMLSRIRLYAPARVVAAHGSDHLEAITLARTAPDGGELSESRQTLPCSLLAMGQGFAPNTELARLAGCVQEYDADRGGWLVKVSSSLETSLPGLFAAGELTGIAGAGKSLIEGRLAALSISKLLGHIKSGAYERQARPLRLARKKELAFGMRFNRLCQIPDQALREMPGKTIVCRCEELTLDQVDEAIRKGATTPNALKRAMRAGMGICQGRICGPLVHDLLRVRGKQNPFELDPLPVRAPAKAVRLGDLAEPMQYI
ncbi:MAG: FAD-dependent oxidoreductase [Deltaproteobacteria bacterium]|nr:FAD-dependent oxidoreductase [Deltaproteobacteria bacterium]